MSTDPFTATSTADIEHAEAVWRILSEAVDSVSEPDREDFLTRLLLLTAIDHLTTEDLGDMVATARDTSRAGRGEVTPG